MRALFTEQKPFSIQIHAEFRLLISYNSSSGNYVMPHRHMLDEKPQI